MTEMAPKKLKYKGKETPQKNNRPTSTHLQNNNKCRRKCDFKKKLLEDCQNTGLRVNFGRQILHENVAIDFY